MPTKKTHHCIEIPWKQIKDHLRGGFDIPPEADFSIDSGTRGKIDLDANAHILVRWSESKKLVETRNETEIEDSEF